MTSSPDNTVDKILDDIIHIGYVNGYNQLAQMAQVAPYNHVQPISVDQAKQSLDSYYLSIFLEKIDGYLNSEDNDGIPNYDVPVMSILNELRTALQDRLGEK